MALKNNGIGKTRCEIFNEIDNDGIDEFRFRVIDEQDKILLSSSKRYLKKDDAHEEFNEAINALKSSEESIQRKQNKNKQWYFNVINRKSDIIARRIQFFNERAEMESEITRLREIVSKHEITIIDISDVSITLIGGTGETSDGECKRDKKICYLHEQILGIYRECFSSSRPDIEFAVSCGQDIIDLIEICNRDQPDYKLVQNLRPQIDAIYNFTVRPGTRTYTIAQNAINEILTYLFNLGDCDCIEEPGSGEGLEIQNLDFLQSKHFYLQAAGSLGDDSTKGIHLRWMLKGALSNHLPKANYAVPGVNFNRNNDFVKIYRTPYIQRKTQLNFEETPKQIDHANALWVYVVNGEPFHIYFLDQAKYAQTLVNVNPVTDRILFLREYGDAVIEIEHKTELSFCVKPTLVSTASGSQTFVEILSVECNEITAPKAVTLRKKYSTGALNNKPLFSENIRSIRLKIQHGYALGIAFEFYSVLVNEANSRNAWSYIGQYALTKNANLAFQRLEPNSGDVHNNWLRYNDNANVNIDNYKDRWNGSTVPPENQISETVNTYINLSDDPTNPMAIESFLINDATTSSDPNYDPSDNEFDLSNLFVLQLASLDYHIARMLGLGILDLDNQVFDGKYVYLAEYVTEGDLQDGLGKRNVQHFYCSLPTALTDERLPIPIDLKQPVPGIVQGQGTEAPQPITDDDGYSHDGKTRFISLFNEDLPNELENQSFYYINYEFISADNTLPVYGGIEYKRSSAANWRKPELPFDGSYLNIDSTVPVAQKNETRPIVIPEVGFPLFVHREKDNGWHTYSSYGINWFSRATSSTVNRDIETVIEPTNTLEPPTNVNAVLIREESPLLLTSAQEQADLSTIVGDKTFIRLTFDYNHGQEMISYHRTINGDLISGYTELADADELFGEDFEVFFRNRVPVSVSGKVQTVLPHGNPILATIVSDEFPIYSAGTTGGVPDEVITPSLIGTGDNFAGSILTIDGVVFRIHQVDNTGTYPKFIVFKNDANGFPVELGSTVPPSDLTSPVADGLFVAIENMLTPENWSLPDPTISTTLPVPLTSPLAFKVNIDLTAIHREEVTITTPDGTVETHVKKFRGVYGDALIEREDEDTTGDGVKDTHLGLYKITFNGYSLAQHSQNGAVGHEVEWYNGIVRVHTSGDSNGPRKTLKVIRTENIGTTNDLIVYCADTSFDPAPTYDEIQVGTFKVNYYPGYKAYFYHDAPHLLEESHILPNVGEGIRYSIFGLRTHDHALGFYSRISQPVIMFAQEIVEPQQPRLPVGGLYATRPDFFGKASYTFTTIFEHKPYSVQFKRASDIQILSTIYKSDELTGPTDYNVDSVMADIFENRESIWFQDRWNNLLSWDYTADGGLFEQLPNDPTGVRLPLPNNPNFIASINTFIDGHNTHFGQSVAHVGTITSLHQIVIQSGTGNGELQLVDFMRDIIFNCFVPLTEIPVIYDHIKGPSYTPLPKKQVVRDRNGNLLNPTDPTFDMAPMMKIVGTGSPNHKTQFTDFGLDGASNAKYFYVAREMNLQMKTGLYSPILGPISLVNTAPPSAPEIVKITPILENEVFSIPASIEVQLNGYPKEQNIKKIHIYRATNPADALSIRTMDRVSELDVELAGIQGDEIWKIQDDFSDLGYVPYGDPLFYKVIVQRQVKYNDKDGNLVVDDAPSSPSKMTLTNIVENRNPEAPDLSYYATPLNIAYELDTVTLSWDKTVHNGSYTIHKMNASGNWEQIHEIQSNDAVVQVQLVDTTLTNNLLTVQDAGGNAIYHHFKIIAKNFAGMISREEKILTIYNPDTWQDIATI